MMKRAFLYGLAGAAGMVGWTMVEYLLGFHTSRAEVGRYTGFVGLAFPVIAIAMALRAARSARGTLSFGEGFAQGAAVSAVLALLAAVAIWLYFTSVNPEFLETEAAQAISGSAAGQAGVVLVSSFVFGIIVSVIAAALLRRGSGGAHD